LIATKAARAATGHIAAAPPMSVVNARRFITATSQPGKGEASLKSLKAV